MKDFDIRKILVPVDFSAASLNALETAIAMARRHEASILLLNVIETTGLAGTAGDVYQTDEGMVEMVHQSEQELHRLRHSIIERFMIHCEVVAARGIASATIIKVSAEKQADLIIMGTHGDTGGSTSFIGINAFNVVKGAACPVLTVPPHKKWESFKKILFPVRPIPAALEKYDFIRKIISTNDATLKILGLATNEEGEVDWVKEMAVQLNEQLKEDHVEASTYFKVGLNMAEEVLKIALIMETDLIVITTNLDAAADQPLMAPYTRYIMNHAKFPVLSIKPCGTNDGKTERMQHIGQPYSQQVPFYN